MIHKELNTSVPRRCAGLDTLCTMVYILHKQQIEYGMKQQL